MADLARPSLDRDMVFSDDGGARQAPEVTGTVSDGDVATLALPVCAHPPTRSGQPWRCSGTGIPDQFTTRHEVVSPGGAPAPGSLTSSPGEGVSGANRLTRCGQGASLSDVGTPFEETTTVRAVERGRWAADLDPGWDLRPVPQGGIVAAVALRALAAELDEPTQRLRTFHTTFAAQVASGPVEVEAEVLRRGRTMSQVRGELRNPGAARGHLTTATFGASRRGFTFTDLAPPPPDVPRPDACPSFRDMPPPDIEGWEPMPFWTGRVEERLAVGLPPWDATSPRTRAERCQWFRFDETPVRPDGTLDPLGLVVLADIMPGAVGERVGPSDEMWFAPSVDLTLHLLDDDWRSPWVLGRSTARHAGDGYASADMALWDMGPDLDDPPRLLAYATQVCLFTFA